MGSPHTTRRRTTQLGSTVVLAVALTATGCGSRAESPNAAQQAPVTTDDTTATAPDAAAGTTATAPDAAAGTTATAPDAATGTTATAPAAAGGAGPAAGGKKTTTEAAGTTPAGGGVDIKGPDSQGITATSIKIGVIAPLSGAAGFLGEAEVAAVRSYTSDVNAKGGTKGRKYSLVVADSQFEPALEVQAARKLVDQDKVFALISVMGDSAGPYVTSKGIPNLVFGLNPPAFSSKYPTTHVTGFSAMDGVTRMAYGLKVLRKKPINSAAILYDTSNIPIGPWVKYLTAAWEAAGVQVKSTDAFNVSDADCTGLVLKMQNLKIDFWQAVSLAWQSCAAAMGRQGWHPAQGFGGPYSSDQRYITQAGAAGMDGAYGQQIGIQILQNFGQPYTYGGQLKGNVAPQAQAYVDSITKYAPNSADPDILESIWLQSFWVSAQVLVKAIEAQTSAITWQGVNQWVGSQKSYKSGLVGPINFDPKCKTGAPLWMYQWKFNKTKGVFEQTPWKDLGGPYTVPDSFLNKIVPGGGQCYLTRAADAEL